MRKCCKEGIQGPKITSLPTRPSPASPRLAWSDSIQILHSLQSFFQANGTYTTRLNRALEIIHKHFSGIYVISWLTLPTANCFSLPNCPACFGAHSSIAMPLFSSALLPSSSQNLSVRFLGSTSNRGPIPSTPSKEACLSASLNSARAVGVGAPGCC